MRIRYCIAVAGGVVISLSGEALGQLEDPQAHNRLYIGTGNGYNKKEENGVIIGTWAQPATDGPICVASDIRAMGHDPGDFGNGYTLNGILTGFTYENTTAFNTFLDGTTDGTNFNYSIRADTGEVWRFDRDWQPDPNFVPFGTLPQTGGITFNVDVGTIWVNHGTGTQEAREYDLAGNLVSAFNYSLAEDTSALAYDPVHGTLWMCSATGNSIYEFSLGGTHLGTISPNDPDLLEIECAEFNIPAPGVSGVLAALVLGAARRRARV